MSAKGEAEGPALPGALPDEAMIRAVVDRFYARAREDDVIGPVFRRVVPDERWQEHLATIADFWSNMLLATGRYQGRPMPKHLAIPELGDRHFIRWLELFRETAEEVCPPEIARLFVERAERVGNAFRLTIAMRRGESVVRMKPLSLERNPI